MSINPDQKTGMETPMRTIPMDRKSKIEFCQMAATIPTKMPRMMPISADVIATSMVMGKALKTSLITFSLVAMDLPKSPLIKCEM